MVRAFSADDTSQLVLQQFSVIHGSINLLERICKEDYTAAACCRNEASRPKRLCHREKRGCSAPGRERRRSDSRLSAVSAQTVSAVSLLCSQTLLSDCSNSLPTDLGVPGLPPPGLGVSGRATTTSPGAAGESGAGRRGPLPGLGGPGTALII